jgi:hypothetical protein
VTFSVFLTSEAPALRRQAGESRIVDLFWKKFSALPGRDFFQQVSSLRSQQL